MHAGSCLCGAIQYEVSVALNNIIHCHCSMCRKAHGAAYGSYCRVPARAFRYLSGEQSLGAYRSSEAVVRSFCRHCGSTLHWVDELHFKEWLSLAVGTLDTLLHTTAQQHIHVWSKAPWHQIYDGFKQHRYGPTTRRLQPTRTST